MTRLLIPLLFVFAFDDLDKPIAREYAQMKSKAGADAESQTALALWCERHGLSRERTDHLNAAVKADPTNEKARALLGLVHEGGEWKTPEQAASAVKADAKLTATLDEYHALRSISLDKTQDQWKLANWCDEHGLKQEARAHYAAVVRLDRTRDLAWKRLGYKKVKGVWTTDEQHAHAKAELELRKRADKKWFADLSRWKEWLSQRNPQKRDEAARALEAVADPFAVHAVWRAFISPHKANEEVRAIQILGRIDSTQASRCARKPRRRGAFGRGPQACRRNSPQPRPARVCRYAHSTASRSNRL